MASIKDRDTDVFAAWSATDSRVAVTKQVDDGVEVQFGSVFDDVKLKFAPFVDNRKYTLSASTFSYWSADGQSLVFLRRGRAYFGLASDLQLKAFAGHDEMLTSYRVADRPNDIKVQPPRNNSSEVTELWNLGTLTVDRADILRKLRSQSPDGAWTVDWIPSEKFRDYYQNPSQQIRDYYDFVLRRVGNEEPVKTDLFYSRYGSIVTNWSSTSRQVAFQGQRSISIVDVDADGDLPERPGLRTRSSVSSELGNSFRRSIPMPFNWSPKGDSFLWCGDKHPQIRDSKTFAVVHELSKAEEPEAKLDTSKSRSGISALFGGGRSSEERFPWTSAADWSSDGTRIAIATSTQFVGTSHSSKFGGAPNVVTVWQRDAEADSWKPLRTFEIKQSSSWKPETQTRPRRMKFSEDGNGSFGKAPALWLISSRGKSSPSAPNLNTIFSDGWEITMWLC